MSKRRIDAGFTAVELIVALIVGVLLLGSAYQLYTVVISDTGDAQRTASASNYAYQLVREYSGDAAKVKSPCAGGTYPLAVPESTNLPGATATIKVTCPYPDAEDLNLVTAIIEFDNANERGAAVRAITVDATDQ